MIKRNVESLKGADLFRQDHQEIVKLYGKDIPAPNPDLKLCVVVPASAELENDNFWRMIRSFLHQKPGTPFTAFELLYVINNPQSAEKVDKGKKVTDNELSQLHQMTDLPKDKLALRYRENQRHLAIISTIQTVRAARDLKQAGLNWEGVWEAVQAKLRPLGLTEYELTLVEQTIVKGLAVRVVDVSTGKRAFKPDPERLNPSGKARNIGGHVAYDRLRKTIGTDGLIDFLDADAFVSPGYVTALLKHQGTADYFVKPMYSAITEIPKAVTEVSSTRNRLPTLLNYLKEHYHSYFISYPKMSFDFVASQRQGLGGPQLTVSAQTFEKVGGYAVPPRDPDYKFSETLQDDHSLSPIVLSDATVFVADRQRPGSVDGAGRVGLAYSLAEARDKTPYTSALKSLLILDHAFSADPDLEQPYRAARARRFRQESLGRLFFNEHAKKILMILHQIFEKNSDITVADLLPPTSMSAITKLLNRRELDYLQQNPVVVEAVLTLFTLVKEKSDEVLQVFGKNWPPDQSPVETTLAILRIIIPEQFAEPPKAEPDYDQILTRLKNDNDYSRRLNFRDFAQLSFALNDMFQQYPQQAREIVYNSRRFS